MFCPKCGSQNAENVRFCRSCGLELETVNAALTGRLSLQKNDGKKGCDDEQSNDPDKLWSSFISKSLTGLAFIVIALYLTFSGAIGGNVWGFWLLIPGAASLASGISSYAKAKRIEQRRAEIANFSAGNAAIPPFSNANTALPPRQTLFANDYAPPVRNTGELLTPPASVTETTTRHLNIKTEGETFNLPNQK
jgi:hypothetical protein